MGNGLLVTGNKQDFKTVLSSYVLAMEAIFSNLPTIMMFMSLSAESQIEDVSQLRGSLIGADQSLDDNKYLDQLFDEKPHDLDRLFRGIRRADKFKECLRITPAAFLIAMVSQYDHFVGQLLTVIFETKPDAIEELQKTIKLSDLTKFSSIEAAKKVIIEREVETFLRESHINQFQILETKFGIKLREGLESWSKFVEITERRNLITHTNGIVSDQYIQRCIENKVSGINEVKAGDILGVDSNYFEDAFVVLMEVGIKLGYVLWRKIRKEENVEADIHYNQIAFEAISDKRYLLAKELLEFSVSGYKGKMEDRTKKMMTINLANCYRLMDENKKSENIVDLVDWSACGPEFRLAVEVIKENNTDAADIMRSLGKNGPIKKIDYVRWPLFLRFRKTVEFGAAYFDVFGETWAIAGSKEETLRLLEKLTEVKKKIDDLTEEIGKKV